MFSYSCLRHLAGPALGLAVSVAAALGADAQTPVKLTLDWRFEGPAAPFTAALDKGYFKAEGLDVTIDTGSGSRESIPRVAAGTYDIGTGDVNSLIRFRDENPGGLSPGGEVARHRRMIQNRVVEVDDQLVELVL